MQTQGFRIHEFGDESVLRWETMDLPSPGPGQTLIRHTAIGVNFVDIYMREGHHTRLPLPATLGVEAAGIIEMVGPDVDGFAVGDRVVYASGDSPGAYAHARLRNTHGLIKLPDWIDDRTAAAALTKGTTVEYLVTRAYPVRAGETALLTAAAGGVGLIACQWLKALGVTVIGVVSTPEKAALALARGCDHVVVSGRDDVVETAMRVTSGVGVDVVYESVGRDSWASSLASVRRRGMVICFGAASGPPPAFDILEEGSKKSIYLHRATTANYQTDDAIRQASAQALFAMMRTGAVVVDIGAEYPLHELPAAHAAIAARRTTGSVILTP